MIAHRRAGRRRAVTLGDPRYRLISLDELYRTRPWPKPRKARRLRRARARRWAAMSPSERALWTFIRDEMLGLVAAANTPPPNPFVR